MITHYLKIAFRNIWKYKSQTLISVLGLAVGFTCFALATLWIVYEMSFDGFHKKSRQLFVVYRPFSSNQTGYSKNYINYPLAEHLKGMLPEIANAAPLRMLNSEAMFSVAGVNVPASALMVDSSFLKVFDVEILEGSREFTIPGSNKIAITKEKARQLFGNEHPIGKTVRKPGYDDFTICAIVSGMAKRSIYAFDFLQPFRIWVTEPQTMWSIFHDVNVVLELFPGTNIKAFEKKLYELETGTNGWGIVHKMLIKPITKIRYADPEIEREVKFEYIIIFAISGLLIVFCSLFNYLTLFVSRFQIRQKELALRVVFGASGRSLLKMMTLEFMLMLLFAVLLGCYLTELAYKPFLKLSLIQMDLPVIFREMLLYIGVAILVSLFLFWVMLFVFRRRSLNMSLNRVNKNLFRKISVAVQLFISISFAFCSLVIMKQIFYLNHTDEIGFSFQNRASLEVHKDNIEVVINRMNQLPEITDVVFSEEVLLYPILPEHGRSSLDYDVWDDMPTGADNLSIEYMHITPEYATFYDFRLVSGEMLVDTDPNSMVLINESAVKVFGWDNPIGKSFGESGLKKTVKGVIKHVCNYSPTMPEKPVYYEKPILRASLPSVAYDSGIRDVLFKYQKGMWKSLEEKINQMANEFKISGLNNMEEEYNKYMQSEQTIIKIFTFSATICVIICVFGFVSLVSLTCEERRKSIAIRKINGATSGDILAMFAKEYFLLLIVGATLAFSAGYFIMQRWLEHYVKQTSIPVWIYLSIIFVMAFVIVLCVGWQVYKASVENPAEAVKYE